MVGFDFGQYDICCCYRDENNNFSITSELNAFVPTEKDQGSLIKYKNRTYLIGHEAKKQAYKTFILDNNININEPVAYEILKNTVIGILMSQSIRDTTICYTMPNNSCKYSEIIYKIFNSYLSADRQGVKSYAINKGLALIYAELAPRAYTGLAINFGTFVNICYAEYGHIQYSNTLAYKDLDLIKIINPLNIKKKIDVVIAGGNYNVNKLRDTNLKIGSIIIPKDPYYAAVRGALLFAENR